MFNNPFLKKDPLLEAVKAAQADGDMRRQAEAIVNEEFGVYSRKAVVREDLAAYDAALEDIYEALKGNQDKIDLNKNKKIDAGDFKMLRDRKKHMEEGKGDGNLANNYPPYDKVTRGDVIAGATGKDQMGGKKKVNEKKMWEGSGVSGEDPGMEVAKQAGAAQQSQTPTKTPTRTGNAAGSTISNARSAAGMNEAQLDELKAPTGKTAMQAYRRAERSDDETGDYSRSSRIYKSMKKRYPGKSGRVQKDTGKADLPDFGNVDFHKAGYSGHVSKSGKLTKAASRETKDDIKSRLGKHTKPHLPEEAQLDELTGKGKLPHMKAIYQDAKNIHSKEADWHAARADRHERRGEDDKAEHHMDVGSEHEHKAERAGSKLKRANALMTRAKAVSDIKSSKSASKSARAEYKEETMNEAKKWIQAAIKKKGALSKQLGVPEKENIPARKLAAAAEKGGKLGKRARLAQTLRKLHKEDVDSFRNAQETGKSVNEIAMTTPPAIVQPVVPSMKQTQAPGIRGTAQFGKQGAGARPLTPTTQNVVRGKPSMLNTVRNAITKGMSDAGNQAVKTNIAKGMTDAGSKVAQVASKAPGVAARVAQLASRAGPLGAAFGAGAAASYGLGKLATGTETGRAIGKSIGRAINPPVSSLPKSEPATTTTAKPASSVGIKKGDTMTSIARANKTTVTDLAKANPNIKDVNKISAGKSLNLPSAAKPAYTPKPVDQAATIRASGGEPNVQTGTAAPKSAPTPPVRPADLGKTTANVPTPPSRPAELDLPKIDTGPKAGPASTPQSAAAAAPKPAPEAPTPPSRPAELDLPKIDKGPKLNPNKPGLQESVQVGDNKYRIV